MADELAHSGGHLLAAHLQSVAQMAADFSAVFEPAAATRRWAYLAGLWHDLGKYRPGFQRYVAQADNLNAHIEGKVGGREKTHSAAGALWAIQTLGQAHGPNGALAARVLAYLIASHHAGLYDWNSGLNERLQEEDCKTELAEARAANPPENILSQGDFVPDLRCIPGGSAGFALWVRLLFSCLVDADFLDTEAHFDAGKPAHREGFPTLEAMQTALNAAMTTKAESADATLVNSLRADVLRQCRDKAALPAGFFSLTVPTGGGKTLSSLAFALKHALTHGKSRVIYAIPYTSIIEQTADVFRDAFKALGNEVLIEHHSQADAAEKDETARSRLACENWDAPLVVTTNVQLFESLFAAKTSRCRKLHNLVNSVIVLDEAQQLPPEFLQPILDVLNLLVTHYGVTVVLCTATQPPAKHGTAPDGGPQLLEGFLGHVRVAGDAVGMADQFTLAVFGHFHVLVIDAQDVALLVGLRDNAGDVHDLGADPELTFQFSQMTVDFITIEQALQQGIVFGLCHDDSFKQ